MLSPVPCRHLAVPKGHRSESDFETHFSFVPPATRCAQGHEDRNVSSLRLSVETRLLKAAPTWVSCYGQLQTVSKALPAFSWKQQEMDDGSRPLRRDVRRLSGSVGRVATVQVRA